MLIKKLANLNLLLDHQSIENYMDGKALIKKLFKELLNKIFNLQMKTPALVFPIQKIKIS